MRTLDSIQVTHSRRMSAAPARAMVGVLSLLAAVSGCRDGGLERLEDRLGDAVISAEGFPTEAPEARELLWDFDEAEVSWRPVEGRMGFRPGELVVKGEGRYPVITSPEAPEIDWARYETLLIRMRAAAGSTIKIKFEHQEYSQPLAEPLKPHVYRFDLGLNTPTFSGRLDILPTDSPDEAVAIDWIKLVPRATVLPHAAGVVSIEKRSQRRRAVYAHSPSSIAYTVDVPDEASLRVGLGVVESGRPVRFRVLAGEAGEVVYEGVIRDAGDWTEVTADLSGYAGADVRLTLETAAAEGVVGLWATPTLIGGNPLSGGKPKARPNVLLYLVDTLRPDHTSLYGYGRDTTPFLRELGAQGVVFDDCHAQSTWTKPSVASLLTSLYTESHGLNEIIDVIPPGATTLAEALRSEGYVTAAFLGNPFAGRSSGLDRGVDYLFEYPAVHRRREAEDQATDSEAINRTAFEWLDRHGDEPFFLYLHSTDPHAPYRPPAEMTAKFGDPSEDAAFERDSKSLRSGRRRYGGSAVFNREQSGANGVDADLWVRRAIDRYDAKIAHNDRAIKRLIEKLEELGVLENTLIVVVSDHGEEFLEHGWTSHGHTLYQELTRAMLIVWSPKLLPTPRRIDGPVQLVDVMPTVLELLGIETEAPMEGRSLAGVAKGLDWEGQPFAMASRLRHSGTPPAGGGVPENWTSTAAWIGPDWKLLYRDRAAEVGLPEIELYDRRSDRGDQTNLAEKNPEIVATLRSRVEEWVDGRRQVKQALGESAGRALDRRTLERLRSLGYLSGGSSGPSNEAEH